MASWSIAPIHLNDLDDFVQCQFLAFVGNPLHDVLFPTQPAAKEAHRKAFSEALESQAGNEILYLKAVDDASGKIIGGIKCCYYAGEDGRSSSPYAAAIPITDPNAIDDEQYSAYVLKECFEKRVSDIRGQHASKLIV